MSDLGKYHPNIPKPIQNMVHPSNLRVDKDEAEDITTLFIVASLSLVVLCFHSGMYIKEIPGE